MALALDDLGMAEGQPSDFGTSPAQWQAATVLAVRPTRYLTWSKGALGKMLQPNPTVAMKTVLSMDPMKKLGGAPA